MSTPRATRAIVHDGEIHVELALGEHVACPVIATIGQVEVKRYSGSVAAHFATGALYILRGVQKDPATLCFGTEEDSLTIALDAMQCRQLWRSLTGGPIPAPQHVCPEHHEVMAEESPGRPVCIQCVEAAREQEVVA